MTPLTTLRLAFQHHMLNELAKADKRVVAVEEALLESLVPDQALRAAGLFEDDGTLGATFDAARAEALERLPIELSLQDKLDLVKTFLDMCIVDEHLDASEGSLLFQASQLLAVTPQQFDRFLDLLDDDVGTIDGDLEQL